MKSILDIDTNIQYKLTDMVVFDIETSGLSYKTDDILEIAIQDYYYENNKFHTYLFSDKEISERNKSINKIKASDISKAPKVNDILNHIYKNYSQYIFIGHNCHEFDAKFFIRKSPNLFLEFKFLDTKHMARNLLPGLNGGYSMTNLTDLFGITINNQHTAKGDVEALCKLYNKLSKLLDKPSDIENFIKKGSQIASKMKD